MSHQTFIESFVEGKHDFKDVNTMDQKYMLHPLAYGMYCERA